MNDKPFSADNHYVPQAYLRHWAGSDGKVWTYRTLVSHSEVPLWRRNAPKGFAFREHLYTRAAAGGQTDEIERWLSSDFETPAAPVLHKIANNAQISCREWECLVRFLAAQYVRTPARMAETMKRWTRDLPKLLQDSLAQTIDDAKKARAEGKPLSYSDTYGAELLPIKVTTELVPHSDEAKLKLETVVGRGLWLFSMKRLLTSTLNALLMHRWTILLCPHGTQWLTSDDPVVQLNFHSASQYDFGGGWGSKGTEIFMPLSPRHLLYTKIGDKPPMRGTIVTPQLYEWVQRFTIEHAHRFVIGSHPDPFVAKTRPRDVNPTAFKEEAEHWARWDKEQTDAEQRLTTRP